MPNKTALAVDDLCSLSRMRVAWMRFLLLYYRCVVLDGDGRIIIMMIHLFISDISKLEQTNTTIVSYCVVFFEFYCL